MNLQNKPIKVPKLSLQSRLGIPGERDSRIPTEIPRGTALCQEDFDRGFLRDPVVRHEQVVPDATGPFLQLPDQSPANNVEAMTDLAVSDFWCERETANLRTELSIGLENFPCRQTALVTASFLSLVDSIAPRHDPNQSPSLRGKRVLKW